MRRSTTKTRSGDALLLWVLRVCAAISGLVVAFVYVFVTWESVIALADIGLGSFVTDAVWGPDPVAADGHFRLMPMVLGTLLVTLGAITIAAPAGILSALFCRYYAPESLQIAYRRIVELLAGVPSVVYGFWGIMVLVPLLGSWEPPGASVLAGALVLALMILPTITLFTDSALDAVPVECILGAAATGFSRSSMIFKIFFPIASHGIVTGLLLATGRALGETLAVLMVTGNVVHVPSGLFDPVRTLTANIALEMAYALGAHRSALFFSGLVLLLLVTLCVVAASAVTHRRRVHG